MAADASETSAKTLTVLSTLGLYGVLTELAPQFERESGATLRARFDPATALATAIEGGEAFDVAVLTVPLLEALTETGFIARGSRADIASSGIGVAVRAGARKPDITTPDAFIRTVREAKSIIYTKHGASGLYFASLLDRLGLAEEINRKATIAESGLVAEVVARGDAELGIQQMSELLPVAGAEIVGPLPPEFQQTTVFSAGLSPKAADADIARAFVARLTHPRTAALIRAKGLDPV